MKSLLFGEDPGVLNLLIPIAEAIKEIGGDITFITNETGESYIRQRSATGLVVSPSSTELADILDEAYDLVLIGTGEDVDGQLTSIMSSLPVYRRLASVVDSHLNFRRRFYSSKLGFLEELTREIWVSDQGTLNAGLEEGFSSDQLRLVEVPFLPALNKDDLLALSQAVGGKHTPERRVVTFVSEGLGQLGDDLDGSLREINQARILRFSELLLEAASLGRARHNLDIRLIFRRHPKESIGNQVSLPDGFDYESRSETSDSILKISTHVFGLSSRLLYEASEQGIHTASGFCDSEFEGQFVGPARMKISSLVDVASLCDWLCLGVERESTCEGERGNSTLQHQSLKRLLLELKGDRL